MRPSAGRPPNEVGALAPSPAQDANAFVVTREPPSAWGSSGSATSPRRSPAT